jgi:hypothetical protein
MSRDQGDPDHAGDTLGTSVFLNRHREAPLLSERISFLKYLQEQGTSRTALRNVSGQLVHVIRLLKLETLRDVEVVEIKTAARR